MVSKNGSPDAASLNCIDAPKFQDAEPIDAGLRVRRERERLKGDGRAEKGMDDSRDAGIPGRHTRNRPPPSEGDASHPTKNKSSETAEITCKLWK